VSECERERDVVGRKQRETNLVGHAQTVVLYLVRTKAPVKLNPHHRQEIELAAMLFRERGEQAVGPHHD